MTANLATILKPSIEKMRKAVDDSGIFTPEICKAYDEIYNSTNFSNLNLPECCALRMIYMLELKRNFPAFVEWAESIGEQWMEPGIRNSAQAKLAKLLEGE
jgi:hypothetical protein